MSAKDVEGWRSGCYICVPRGRTSLEQIKTTNHMENGTARANKLANWCAGLWLCLLYTFILVVVQQALKLGMKDLQMFLDEDSLADVGQLVVCAFVQIHADAALLFQQSLFGLTEQHTLQMHLLQTYTRLLVHHGNSSAYLVHCARVSDCPCVCTT